MNQLVRDNAWNAGDVPDIRALPRIELIDWRGGVSREHLDADQQPMWGRRPAGIHTANDEVHVREDGIGAQRLETAKAPAYGRRDRFRRIDRQRRLPDRGVVAPTRADRRGERVGAHDAVGDEILHTDAATIEVDALKP